MSEPTPVTTAEAAFVQLPTDSRGSAASGYEAAFHHVSAPDWLLRALERRTQTLFLGAFQAFLYRHTLQSELALDIFVHSADTSKPPALSLRASITAESAVAGLIDAAEQRLAGFSDGPVSVAAPGRRNSNVAVSFCSEAVNLAGYDTVAAGYDLHVLVTSRNSPAPLVIVYNARRFRPDTIERFARSLSSVLTAVVADARLRVGDLPVLDADQLRLLTQEWESGTATYPNVPVYVTFAEHAREQPHAIAAVFKDQTLSYEELDVRSSRLAHHLIACGVRPETTVAVCVMPSFDILVALLAVWKAGGIYVPLDPTHPEAFIGTILREAAPALVVTQSTLRHLTQPEVFRQFCLDRELGSLAALPATAPALPCVLSRPAYLLYTSGTTGRPKGVLATHENLAHYINVARQKYRFTSSDVFCSLARYTFSISLFELVSPLCCGASLRLFERDEVLSPERLAHNLQYVTVLHAGPSLLGTLFRYLRTIAPAPGQFGRMRHASSGGDLVPPHILEEMKLIFENAELYVIYGCTEISCMGCTYSVSRAAKVTASYVGKPFPDVGVRLLDPERRLVPIGVVGEICFSGKGVVNGYFKRRELDAEKFVEIEGRRYYLTGDMGRFDAEGQLEILGRRDFQIQLRGIRIELAGIENTVKELGLAAECAVLVKKLNDQDERLIAFVVKPTADSVAAFRRTLALHLPDYMVPQGMVVIDALPVTANGKLDRNKLKELPWETKASESGTAPRTAVERKIAAAFADALGVSEVNIDDDFFDLGGHSLLAVTVIHDIENRLGLRLPPGVLFERTTVRALAEHATDSFGSVQKPLLLAGKGDKPALFMLLGVHLYRDLARRLERKYSVYGVYAGRELVMFEATGEAPPVTELAREYIEIIRRQQPVGPYRLGGMSFGGIVAYEAAQQLEAAGEEVMFLGMIDAVLPEPGLRGRWAKARRVLGLPPGEFLSLVANPLRSRWNSTFRKRPNSEFVKYSSDEKLGQLEARRQAAYARSVQAYVAQMRSFVVNATVIVSGRRLARYPLQSPDCGWTHFVPSIDVHVLDADHIALVEEPAVRRVAEIFLSVLSRTEEARSIRSTRLARVTGGVAAPAPETR